MRLLAEKIYRQVNSEPQEASAVGKYASHHKLFTLFKKFNWLSACLVFEVEINRQGERELKKASLCFPGEGDCNCTILLSDSD